MSRAAGMSDVGRCRKVNQDMFLLDDALGLYAIADGMGGHAAGEVASDLAITALARSLRDQERQPAAWSPAEAGELLRQALNDGNRKICESVLARAEWRGMGTTMGALPSYTNSTVSPGAMSTECPSASRTSQLPNQPSPSAQSL